MSFLPSPRVTAFLLACGLVIACGAARNASAQIEPGQFFLSWNAPYGEPRARDQRTIACGDTSERDTLFVTFETGRDSVQLIAVDARIRIVPAPPDTLERHWWFESRSNPAHLTVDFNLEDSPGAARIWPTTGAGGVRTVSGPTGAQIRLVWAVRPMEASVVRGGTRYGFARLVIPRPRDARVCERPLCFELEFGRFAFDVQDEHAVRDGKRWVSWNPGDRAPCAGPIRQGRVKSWRPPIPGTGR